MWRNGFSFKYCLSGENIEASPLSLHAVVGWLPFPNVLVWMLSAGGWGLDFIAVSLQDKEGSF